jgi:hypothetical protein
MPVAWCLADPKIGALGSRSECSRLFLACRVKWEVPDGGRAEAGVRPATAGTAVGAAAGLSGFSAWLAGFPAGIWGGPGEGVWSERGLGPCVHG